MRRISLPLICSLVVVSLLVPAVISEECPSTEASVSNSTTAPGDGENKWPTWTGFFGCIIASLFFGSNLLPVKQFSVGDGFFFQFVYCVAVWAVGLIVDLILGNDRFYPLVLVGGFLWTTGNLVTVFCIKTCGLSVGLLIWGTTSLVMGWAGGRFGFFGVTAEEPSTRGKIALNYLGVIFAALSGIFFLFIKSTNTPKTPNAARNDDGDSSVEMSKIDVRLADEVAEETDFPFLNRFSPTMQKVIGCTLAACAGIFYGTMFIPDKYIRDHPERYTVHNKPPPKNGLYYINSQYCGILLSSLFYFVLYAALKRNKPWMSASIAIPAMVSGVMWAVANIGFIVAISTLGGSVAYPIVNVLPGVVSSLWSLFLFKEIQGRRNFIFLGIGMFLRLLAAIFSGLSS